MFKQRLRLQGDCSTHPVQCSSMPFVSLTRSVCLDFFDMLVQLITTIIMYVISLNLKMWPEELNMENLLITSLSI